VVFIPVALNYDRVLEDRVLIEAGRRGERRFRARLPVIAGFVLRILWQRLRGRFKRFGYAAVSFGAPLSLAQAMKDEAGLTTDRLAEVLMARIRGAVPVLPVPLVAALIRDANAPVPEDTLVAQATEAVERLQAAGVHVHLPGNAPSRAVSEGLAALSVRGIVLHTAAGWLTAAGEEAALSYYAASVEHALRDAATAKPLPPG